MPNYKRERGGPSTAREKTNFCPKGPESAISGALVVLDAGNLVQKSNVYQRRNWRDGETKHSRLRKLQADQYVKNYWKKDGGEVINQSLKPTYQVLGVWPDLGIFRESSTNCIPSLYGCAHKSCKCKSGSLLATVYCTWSKTRASLWSRPRIQSRLLVEPRIKTQLL